MMEQITEEPQEWVILKLPDNEYKVFGSWSGGYLDGDRWKLNSGIKSVEYDGNYYHFLGYSGSWYKCHKKSYGINSNYGKSVLQSILEKGEGQIEELEDQGWLKLIDKVWTTFGFLL